MRRFGRSVSGDGRWAARQTDDRASFHRRAPSQRHQAARRAVCLLIVALQIHAGVLSAHAESLTDEKVLGRKFELQARQKLPLLSDIELTSYVDRIGQKIVAALGDQPFIYHFFVVRDGRVNAFAVPGGYVYVNGGLLARVQNDDELAGVLGHEIAHVHAHHLARQQEATEVLNYAALIGVLLSAVQPAVGAGAAALNAATQLQYRREFEQDADYLGARYMQQAGYDARGMLDFLKKMLDEQRGAPSLATPYLLSHPLTDARLTNLEAVLKTHQWDHGPRRPRSLELERVQLLVRARSEPAQEIVLSARRKVEAEPDNPRALYLAGQAYFEAGLFDNARASFLRVRQFGFPGLERELGRTLFRLRQTDAALSVLRAAIEADPGDAAAYYELARVLEARGEESEAIRNYERAVDLAPTLEEAQYALGLLAGRAGDAGKGYYHLGMAYYLHGELEKALSQFERAAPLLDLQGERAEELRANVEDLRELLNKGK